MRDAHFDVRRMAVLSGLTAALSVGTAETLLYHESHIGHIGPTSPVLSEGAAAIAGACLALAIGSLAAGASVRHGSRVASGLIVGVIAFLVGVVPYAWLTSPSGVGARVNVVVLVLLFVVAGGPVTLGAAIGAAVRGRPPSAKRL